MEHEVEISRERTGLGHPEAARLIKKAIHMALSAEGVEEPCLISVMLTDDEGIRAVNREFRNIDRATDILSFPMNELTPGDFDPDNCDRDPETGALMLGERMDSRGYIGCVLMLLAVILAQTGDLLVPPKEENHV